MHHRTPEQEFSAVMRTLGDCGFQPLGETITQGSGLRGRALSADGSAWVDIQVGPGEFRRGLRRFLMSGGTRVGIALAFHTEFNDGSSLDSRLDAAPAMAAEDLAAAAALRHMQALEHHLRHHHPLKPAVQAGLGDVLRAEHRARLRQQAPALSAEALSGLGVAPHLAQLIAGPCAGRRETLPI